MGIQKGRFYVFGFILIWLPILLYGQKKVPSSYCLHPVEKQLADSINHIRKIHGKKAIPLSVSLCYVARTHVNDLLKHHPDTSICNLSSWSNKGHWKPCCYNRYVTNHECMWRKPKELTSYPYRGYEMAAYSQDNMNIDSIIAMWEVSPEALDMILTKGIWEKKSWACMGIGVNRHYISVWFGQRADRAGKPKMCHKTSKNKISKTISHGYYLIYGSFPDYSTAIRAQKRVKAKGFTKAGILKSGKYIRVYLYRSSDFQYIKKERQKWKKKYPGLWILQE
jgi:hypothetical protein